MGAAKDRGDKDARVSQAKAKMDFLRPTSLLCNTCQSDITEIHDMDIRNVPGLDAAFAGVCSKCKSTTYAIKGTPVAMTRAMEALEKSTGTTPLVGWHKIGKKDS